jgi:uncharacterized protein YndB with AHSA1/START domain
VAEGLDIQETTCIDMVTVIYLNDQVTLMRTPTSLFLLVAIASAFGQSQAVTVTKESTPVKALVFEVMVPAPRAEVWQAFTTSDGLSTWLTPGAVTELRNGGGWTAHFPGGKTGGGTILSFVPQQEVVMSAMAPEKFPTVRAERTTAKFQFEAKGDTTLIRLVQTGWKSGKEWDDAYEYLAAGNAQLLETLKRRFVDGPLDWNKEWGPGTVKPAATK